MQLYQFELEKSHRLGQIYIYMETSNPLLKREEAFAGAWDRTEPMTLQGVINKDRHPAAALPGVRCVRLDPS
jgi:hypothetical protein